MSPSERRIGYVVKMYPRFSETFIVNEIRAREAQGESIDIVSLRAPVDPRFHESLAAVRAGVTYLQPGRLRAVELWAALREGDERLPGLGAHLPELLRLSADDAAQSLELAVLVRLRRLDHLHAHFASVATTVARMAARLAGITYSFTAHAKDIFHESVDPDDLRVKLADAHHVVTVSDYNAAHLRRRFPAQTAHLARVYNGLPLDDFARRHAPRRRQVVAVGRLVEKKGFDVLLDAVAELARRGRPVPCVLAGDGALAGPLRDQAHRLGLDELVTFAGPLPQRDVRELVAASAVLCAPCVVGADGNADGLPTVLLEALALGTPTVATRVTGIPEAVRPGQTGLLTEPGDALATADAIERLLDGPTMATTLADAGRALVEREFDARAQAARLRALLPDPAPDAPSAPPPAAAAEASAAREPARVAPVSRSTPDRIPTPPSTLQEVAT